MGKRCPHRRTASLVQSQLSGPISDWSEIVTVENISSQPDFEQTNSLDWSSYYARFLASSGAYAAKTLKLYQEILEYVARGRLPVTVFQEYYPRFVQKHGTGYTERLNELAAEFLRNLVESSAAESQKSEPTENLDGEIPLPVFDVAHPTEWYEQYDEFAGQLNAQALKAYRKQLVRWPMARRAQRRSSASSLPGCRDSYLRPCNGRAISTWT